MALDPAGLNSPRWLTLQHAQRTRLSRLVRVTATSDAVDKDVESRLKPLQDGQAMLYSFFAPALSGGAHTVEAAHEKHIPVYTVDGNTVQVTVLY